MNKNTGEQKMKTLDLNQFINKDVYKRNQRGWELGTWEGDMDTDGCPICLRPVKNNKYTYGADGANTIAVHKDYYGKNNMGYFLIGECCAKKIIKAGYADYIQKEAK
jgi:hypothetical protein